MVPYRSQLWCHLRSTYCRHYTRESTDLGTDSDSALTSVDRNRIRSNTRSVIDPSAICHPPYQLLHRMPPKPHIHKRHKALIALCRSYKVSCHGREVSRSIAHGMPYHILYNSHFIRRMQLQWQSHRCLHSVNWFNCTRSVAGLSDLDIQGHAQCAVPRSQMQLRHQQWR